MSAFQQACLVVAMASVIVFVVASVTFFVR
jgi:hypothetical protein